MRKRSWRHCCACIVASVMLTTVVHWVLTRPYPQLRKTVVAKLFDLRNSGLTLEQVTDLVKAPPGDYSGGFRKCDCGNSGGYSDAALFIDRFVEARIDPTLSPNDLARFQAKMIDWNDVRFSQEVQAKLRTKMQNRKLHGWWGRNRVLIIEVDENSLVQAISYQYCENRPQGWLPGLVWQFDQWFEGKE